MLQMLVELAHACGQKNQQEFNLVYWSAIPVGGF